jgi:hypothetical protein
MQKNLIDSFNSPVFNKRFMRLLLPSILAHWSTAVFASVITTPRPKEYTQQLASLLMTKGKPSVSDLDSLVKGLYLSAEYNQISRNERLGDVEFEELVDSIAPSHSDLVPAAMRRMRATAKEDAGLIVTADIVLAEVGSDGVGLPVITTSLPTTLPPSEGSIQATQYIITTIDTISHLMLVLNRIDANIKEENYVELIKEFNEVFSPMLAQLANEATDRLFTSDATAARWKDALWQLHLLVANYATEKRGFEQWVDFKTQVLGAMGRLLDYAIVAKTTAGSNTPPPPGTSNAALQQQLQDEAVQTGCLCLYKCLFRICGKATDVKTTSSPVAITTGLPGEYAGPTDSTRKAVELVLFIDSTVASIKSIISEVQRLDSSGPDGEERMKNLKLRIALRLTNLLKQAIANDAFERIYDTLKTRSVLLLGSLSGINSGGWDAIKETVTEVLTAITSDLNSSKPNVV